jgi:hypothetical protein
LESDEILLDDPDAECAELVAIGSSKLRGTIAADDDVPRPTEELQSKCLGFFTPAIDRDRLIPELPAIAIRTVEKASSIKLAGALKRRQLRFNAWSEKELA